VSEVIVKRLRRRLPGDERRRIVTGIPMSRPSSSIYPSARLAASSCSNQQLPLSRNSHRWSLNSPEVAPQCTPVFNSFYWGYTGVYFSSMSFSVVRRLRG